MLLFQSKLYIAIRFMDKVLAWNGRNISGDGKITMSIELGGSTEALGAYECYATCFAKHGTGGFVKDFLQIAVMHSESK